ncbi:MAG: hypothetical protein F4Y00_11235 [Bacteroidetes bacterium SB0662_bin_6]|nr:hypothetical protein [Gammaproteobacteria bacterium]MYE05526.1 hypothetical protein [Bacteroidetes bacterium SB0662_bin_6]
MKSYLTFAKVGRQALAVGLFTLTALSMGAASGLPDNPRDPPPPPSGAGYLFNSNAGPRQMQEPPFPATGRPVITGVGEVGAVLRAWKGTISDRQGTTKADAGVTHYRYRYQWVRQDGEVRTDIVDAQSETYQLTSDDANKEIRVKVRFIDDENYGEGPRTSRALRVSTGLLVGTSQQPQAWHPVTGGVYNIYGQQFTTGSDAAGYTLSAIGIDIHKPPTADETHPPLVTLNQGGSGNEPGELIAVLRNPDSFAWNSVNKFTAPPGALLQPNTQYWVVVNDGIEPRFDDAGISLHWLNAINTGSHAEDPESLPGWSVHDGYAYKHEPDGDWRQSRNMNIKMDVRGIVGIVHTENYPATGQPSISGLAQSGRWLTASSAGIYDSNGQYNAELDGNYASYTYQWLRVDGGNESEIPGGTDAYYLLTNADVGKKFKVKVRFMDDAGNSEGPLTSAEFPSEGTILSADSTEFGPPTPVLVENTSNQEAGGRERIVAQRFLTGSNPNGYNIESVGIGVTGRAATDIKAGIYSMNGDTYMPGDSAGALGTTTVEQDGVMTFPADGDVTLSPDTNYFLVITDRSGQLPADAEFTVTRDDGESSDLADGWQIYNFRAQKRNIDDDRWRGFSDPWKIIVKGSPINP